MKRSSGFGGWAHFSRSLVLTGLTLSVGACSGPRALFLREPDDFVSVGGGRYALPDSMVGPRMRQYAHLEADSVVLYKPDDPPSDRHAGRRFFYLREPRRIGRDGLRILGFTRSDGAQVRYEGTVRRTADVLIFEPRRPGGMEWASRQRLELGVSEVRSLDVTNPEKTAWSVVLFGAAVGLAVVLGSTLGWGWF